MHLKRTRTISDSESTEPPIVVKVDESVEHHASRDNLNAINAFVLCFIWCGISVINNIISKLLLNSFPYPLTSTLSQLLATAICADPIVRLWGIPPVHWERIDRRYALFSILPLGMGKFMAACGTHISVSKLSVSYAHTVKASMPIFVVLLTTVFFGELYSLRIYGSLLVIFFGVCLASITELAFDGVGLISALISTAAFALLNILTKKCLNYTHMHQFRLLLMLARIATFMFLPIWLCTDFITFWTAEKRLSAHYDTSTTLLLLVSDGVLNFSQNLVAFTLIAKVTPVSYAVCNVVKRIAVISLFILFFGNAVTGLNVFGTSLAIMGVFLYNMVKNQHKRVHPLLPSEVLPHERASNGVQSCSVYLGAGNEQEEVQQGHPYTHLHQGPIHHSMSPDTHVSSRYYGYQQQHRPSGALVPIPSGLELNLKSGELLHGAGISGEGDQRSCLVPVDLQSVHDQMIPQRNWPSNKKGFF